MVIAIIGLGLIGGSFGRAILKNTDYTVIGTDIYEENISKAELLGAISARIDDENIKTADIVIFALVPSQFEIEIVRYLPLLKSNAIVMDITGVKKTSAELMRQLSISESIEFISTHPMAGKEFSGISYSSPSLFEGASMLLIPIKAEIETLSKIKELFIQIGFDFVRITSVEEHDKMIAFTSQLAHIISSAYVNNPLAELHDGFSAGSFKDLTRVARMNATMWSELFIENRENLLESLNIFIENINELKGFIENSSFEQLEFALEQGNAKKEAIDRTSREWKRSNSIKS